MNIDCTRLADMLLDFVSGELPAEQMELFEAHMRACPPCYIHVQTYTITVTMTRKLKRHEMPAEVEQRLREAVIRECGDQLG